MRILILGSKGMLAQDLKLVFREENLTLWDKEGLDITNKEMVKRKLKKLKPEIILNTSAYTDVDGAEKKKELAFKINGEAVGYLTEISKIIGAIFTHFSTDYVFGQNKKEGYKEDDKPLNPLNVYGASKLEGERKILKEKGLKYYLIRISWLFGPSRRKKRKYKNFVETILKISEEKKEIKVVNDQFGKPTYTLDVAKAVKNLIENKKPYGIYHLPNESWTNWYNFAKKIVEIAGRKTKILPCKTEDFPRPAKRPKYSILINTKIPKLRNWQEALKDFLEKYHLYIIKELW